MMTYLQSGGSGVHDILIHSHSEKEHLRDLGMKLGIRIPLCYLSQIVGKDVCIRGNSSHTACRISA